MKSDTSRVYKILLCEDDPNLGRILKSFFEINGFYVVWEKDGRLGLNAFRKERFDICLLDVMMPNMDGFSLAKEIRELDLDVPLFFLTAKSMKEDLLLGYKLGADDYITKPFDTDVVLMKIRAIIKRREEHEDMVQFDAPIQLGSMTYDTKTRALKDKEGALIHRLSPMEGGLLVLLYQNRSDVLSRSVALKKIWGTDTYFNSRSMDVYITRLRKYFKNEPGISIKNLYSTGFTFHLEGNEPK